MSHFLAPIVAMTTDRLTTCASAADAALIRDACITLAASVFEGERVYDAALLRSRQIRRGRQLSCEQALRCGTLGSGVLSPPYSLYSRAHHHVAREIIVRCAIP